MGGKPQLGRSAETSPGTRRREPGTALLGPRHVGLGRADINTFINKAEAVNLNNVVDKITVPFLVVHGQNDRQIPVAYAHTSFEQAVNSPKRELRIFTADEGASEHVGLDHLPHVATFVADWVADTFTGLDR